MATYQVQATIVTSVDYPESSVFWQSERQIPTFYLHAEVQGIVSLDHARRVAADILGPNAHIHVADVTGRRENEESRRILAGNGE